MLCQDKLSDRTELILEKGETGYQLRSDFLTQRDIVKNRTGKVS
ncbi:MAG: hypothetical protein ACRC62_31860 [Microcoleus sp.]